jgi:plasmid maintenance system antidote protein VapI
VVLRRRCATLSIAEQANVRALLQVLRVKLLGHNWRNVEQALPVSHSALAEILAGRVEISTTIAFRVAKAFGVSLQEVLTGEAVPPGTCKHCGHLYDGV